MGKERTILEVESRPSTQSSSRMYLNFNKSDYCNKILRLLIILMSINFLLTLENEKK